MCPVGGNLIESDWFLSRKAGFWLTAVFADFLHTIHQPIVSPNVASLGWAVAALFIILMGGVGTLSGAILGAFLFRLLENVLDR